MNFCRLILLFFLLLTLSVYAQYGSTGEAGAKSSGMAGTYNAVSRGVDALGINPANIMIDNPGTFRLGTLLPLPFLSIRTGTSFMSIGDVNYFFGGVNGHARDLTDADKQRFDNLFSNGGKVNLDISLNILSATYKINDEAGALGFSINDFISGNVTFPKAIVDIALSGNQTGKDYNLNDTKVSSWWIRDYALTYANEFSGGELFESITAGISIKYVEGYAYAATSNINTKLFTGDNNQINIQANTSSYTAFSNDLGVNYKFDSLKSNGTVTLFPSPVGGGIGLDFGFNAKINDEMRLSFAITDIGSIKWYSHTAQFVSTGQYQFNDLLSKSQRDSLKDKIVGKADSTGSFSSKLATALRIGYSFKVSDNLILAADYNQGFNDEPGNSTIPRISIAADWKPMDWLPYVRSGFSFGGDIGFHWGLGIGVDMGVLDLNLATSDFQSIVIPNSAKYVSVAFNTRWKF